MSIFVNPLQLLFFNKTNMANSFNHFLNKFPKVKLPQTLKEEDVRIYSANNDPLPDKLIQEFILPHEGESDDLTEFVPCFRLAGLKDFHAVVFWKAELMNYQYIMVTYEKGGRAIDRRVLAGIVSDGNIIIRSVAQLDADMSILIMSGQTDSKDERYAASQSTTLELELLPDGKMMELV